MIGIVFIIIKFIYEIIGLNHIFTINYKNWNLISFNNSQFLKLGNHNYHFHLQLLRISEPVAGIFFYIVLLCQLGSETSLDLYHDTFSPPQIVQMGYSFLCHARASSDGGNQDINYSHPYYHQTHAFLLARLYPENHKVPRKYQKYKKIIRIRKIFHPFFINCNGLLPDSSVILP